MIYTDFQGKELSLLGFGLMRLPTTPQGDIDEAELEAMVDCAIQNGVNYFDTAYPYHGGMSEIAIGKLLKKYPRSSWYLADKFPGHQILKSYDPAAIFEEQLQKCGVDHFDFYLLHNVYEKSIDTYLDPQWGIIDYFVEQKRLGRIRHLGFSTHGRTELIRSFLDRCGEHMEFCQIQLNYLDWSLQDAQSKVALLKERNIPVWVMEPLRGGKLCHLPEEDAARLTALRPDESIPAWGLRFLQSIPTVSMVLSGMSSLPQMQDNLHTFEQRRPLTETELRTLFEVADHMKNSVPCTACRYCAPHCPMGLDIPLLLEIYNELRVVQQMSTGMLIEALPENKRPSACIGCRKCTRMCPQNIDIPAALHDCAAIFSKMPKWADICAEREAAALRSKGK